MNNYNCVIVGFEVFTAVVMKSIIFWDMTPCSPLRCKHFFITQLKSIIFWDVTPCSLLRCNRRFGGTYRLHLQGRRKNCQQEPASKQVASKIKKNFITQLKSIIFWDVTPCSLLRCWFLLKIFSSTFFILLAT
jgi:hypothetical protein